MGDRGPDREVTAEDVLELIENRDREQYPVVSTATLVDDVPVSKRTVLNRLDGLQAAGEVKSTTVGRTKVWWLTGERMVPPGETADIGEAMADGDRPSSGDAEVRERAIEAIERWEEDMARLSARERARREINFFSHAKSLLLGGGLLFAGFILMLLTVWVRWLPELIETVGVVMVLLGLVTFPAAVYNLYRDWRSAYSSAKQEFTEGAPASGG